MRSIGKSAFRFSKSKSGFPNRTHPLFFCCILFYFAISSQICKTFLGLISCKCCNIVFCLSLLYVVFIFLPCKCKYCHKKTCSEINVILKKRALKKFQVRLAGCHKFLPQRKAEINFARGKYFYSVSGPR